MSDTIRAGEMFAGVAGFRYGAERATTNIKTVWSNELDKYAAAVYRFQYGEGEIIEQDIRTIDTSRIPDIDILTGGFPCQSFSVAGKRRGFEDTRGTLFFEVARVLADKRPRYFLLENVKGLVSHDNGKTLKIIVGILADLGYRDIQWCVVNSTCFVPQNRERIFIVGHLGERGRPEIFPIPKDDSLYTGASGEVPTVRCLSGGAHSGGLHSQMTVLQDNRLDSNYHKGGLDKGQRTMVIQSGHRAKGKLRLYDSEVPAMTQDCGTGGGNVPMVVTRHRTIEPYKPSESVAVLPQSDKGENVVCIGHSRASEKNEQGKIDIEYHIKDEVGCLKQPSGNQSDFVGLGDAQFRRLTPVECERLQGFPDDWTSVGLFPDVQGQLVPRQISDTQRYRMLGNAVTTDVISAIISRMAKVWF